MLYLLAAIVAALLIERFLEARRQVAERAQLLQRIQAPERAVIQHEVREAAETQFAQPLSDEEWIAEEKERQAMIAKIEAVENAPWDRA